MDDHRRAHPLNHPRPPFNYMRFILQHSQNILATQFVILRWFLVAAFGWGRCRRFGGHNQHSIAPFVVRSHVMRHSVQLFFPQLCFTGGRGVRWASRETQRGPAQQPVGSAAPPPGQPPLLRQRPHQDQPAAAGPLQPRPVALQRLHNWHQDCAGQRHPNLSGRLYSQCPVCKNLKNSYN